jgi:hypothetical protein
VHPAQFRHEHGREMTHAFSSQLHDAHARSGRAVAAVWAGALVDLVPTAIREHTHVRRQDLRHAIRILTATPGEPARRSGLELQEFRVRHERTVAAFGAPALLASDRSRKEIQARVAGGDLEPLNVRTIR